MNVCFRNALSEIMYEQTLVHQFKTQPGHLPYSAHPHALFLVKYIISVYVKLSKNNIIVNFKTYIIIIGFLINVQVQGQHPHQWAPFQIAGLLHAWQISHQISRYVCHEGWWPGASTLCNASLSAVSMSSWASKAHAFHQSVCQKLSWLHHWSVPHVQTISLLSFRMRSRSSMQAIQVAHWTWWWQCLAVWHCRSVWSLPCYFAADAGGLALSMAKSRWHGALRSTHKSCTHGHVFWKRGGMKREMVADPWTSSRRSSHVLWLKVHSHLLLRACFQGSKRKLPPQAWQVQPGLPSVVCHPRGVQFPGTMYICSQGLFSSAWAHCISCAPSACSHCRRCCCCPLQCDRQRMETHLNSAGGPVPYRRSWSLSFLHLLSVLSSPLLLYMSRASWHIP